MLTLCLFDMFMVPTPPIKRSGLKAQFLTLVATIDCNQFLETGFDLCLKIRGAGGK